MEHFGTPVMSLDDFFFVAFSKNFLYGLRIKFFYNEVCCGAFAEKLCKIGLLYVLLLASIHKFTLTNFLKIREFEKKVSSDSGSCN